MYRRIEKRFYIERAIDKIKLVELGKSDTISRFRLFLVTQFRILKSVAPQLFVKAAALKLVGETRIIKIFYLHRSSLRDGLGDKL